MSISARCGSQKQPREASRASNWMKRTLDGTSLLMLATAVRQTTVFFIASGLGGRRRISSRFRVKKPGHQFKVKN